MTDSADLEPTPEHREQRAHLLPEENDAGSDDREAQAAAILEESEQRTLDPEGTWDASSQSPERD